MPDDVRQSGGAGETGLVNGSPVAGASVPQGLADEAAAAILGGRGDIGAVAQKMASALAAQGLPEHGARQLADMWMQAFTAEVGASAAPDAASAAASSLVQAALAQSGRASAPASVDHDLALALAQGSDVATALLDAGVLPPNGSGAGERLSRVLLDELSDGLARSQDMPAQAGDALSGALDRVARVKDALATMEPAELSPAQKLAQSLATGDAGAVTATASGAPGGQDAFAAALESALSSGADIPDAFASATVEAARSVERMETLQVSQSDGDRMLAALADGATGKAPEFTAGPAGINDAAFAASLNMALGQGTDAEAALAGSRQAQAEAAAVEKGVEVPLNATDRLVSSLASGQRVEEAVQSFAATAGVDPGAAGAFAAALGPTLAGGADPARAVVGAQQSAMTVAANADAAGRGVTADPLAVALSSGENVQQALQDLGVTGGGSAALAEALASGRPVDQALAAAHSATAVANANAAAASVPVSAEDQALAAMSTPGASEEKSGETTEAEGEASKEQAAEGEASEEQAAEGEEAKAEDTEAQADGEAASEDGEEGKAEKVAEAADSEGKADGPQVQAAQVADAGDAGAGAATGSQQGRQPETHAADAGAKAPSQSESASGLQAPASFDAPAAPTKAAGSPLTAYKTGFTTASAAGPASAVQAFQQAPPPVQVQVRAPDLAADFDAAAFAKALALAEDSAAPAGFTVLQAVEQIFRTADAGTSLAGLAIVSNPGSDGGTWQYSLDGSTWSALGAVSDQAALVLLNSAMLRFVPIAGFNGDAPALGARAVNAAWKGGFSDAGKPLIALGEVGGFTAISGQAAGFSLAVTPVNDAPVATTTTATLQTLAENAASPAGASVSTLFSATFSDAADQIAGGSAANALAGVAVVGNAANASQGVWQYWTGSSWADVGAVSNAAALVVKASDSLRFVPAPNWNGTTPALAVRLIDDSAGAVGTGARLDFGSAGTGDSTPYSAATVALTGTVAAVNDAPVATGSAAVLAAGLEDGTDSPGATVSSLFSSMFSDAADAVAGGSAGNGFAGVAVLANASAAGQGSWQYWTGSGWADIGAVSEAAALLVKASDSLRFVPAPNWNGTVPALTVRLIDDSAGAVGSGNVVNLAAAGTGGSTPYSAATNALTSTVTAVNDAPVATGSSAAMPDMVEDASSPGGATVASVFSSMFSDAADAVPGDTAGNGFAGIAIVANAATGTQGVWQYWTGSAWADVGAVSNAAALVVKASDSLRFVPAANWNGTTPALTVRLIDDSAGVVGTGSKVDLSTTGTGGSTPYSATTVALTGAVAAVNDAPVATGSSAVVPVIQADPTTAPGATVSSLFSGLFSDAADAVPGDTAGNGFAGIAIVGNAATASQGVWQYWTGSAWADVGTVSGASALLVKAADSLRFVPAASWNGSTPALTVRLIDDSAGAVGTGGRVDLSATGTGGSTPYSAATVALTGVNVNDAPVLADADLTVTAGGASGQPTGTAGVSVGALVGLSGSSPGNVTDLDPGSAAGIAIVGSDETFGTWWFSTDGGASWQRVGGVDNSANALLLRSTDRLYFEPGSSMPASIPNALTIRAWDQTSGVAGSKVAIDAGGGTSAFSVASDTVALIGNTLLPNGSFDSGGLDEWASIGTVTVAGPTKEAVIDATGGQLIANIDGFLGLAPSTLNNLAGGGATTGSAMKLAAGYYVAKDSLLTFDWSFTTQDSGSFNDFAFVVVNGSARIIASANTGASASGTFKLLVAAGTTLNLGLGVSDYGDSSVSPNLHVDNFRLIPQNGDPVVLDLLGHGLNLTSRSDGVLFDMNADGAADETAWIGKGSALLAYDTDGDGRIADASELVSEHFRSGAPDSLAALASLDTDRNGLVDDRDADFSRLLIWEDADGDGVSAATELRTMAEAGIQSFDAVSTPSTEVVEGSRILGRTTMTLTDGSVHEVAGLSFDVRHAVQSLVAAHGIAVGNDAPAAANDFTRMLATSVGLAPPGDGADATIDIAAATAASTEIPVDPPHDRTGLQPSSADYAASHHS
ncbi:beta strand repeat-containing protein [Arenibaculum pallidiluteum]|uniref:beta strand repeat-containing protein n=1 Tax=Arenibaculum pallidiluteum TaxID=2812559 RepID=UPI001A979DC6|nr:hypothetical protein [Arenibaculum pallidiluteum]